jgi:methionyl-tRNA synthetase
LTTIDYPNKKFKDFWPAVHIIGSDIVWHHTAIWFSILSSLGIELPRVVVHGFINLGGEKLSKAMGITVDPIELSEKYSTDALRYFLLRHVVFGNDGDFSEHDLIDKYNNELANKLGNLVSRVSSLAEKNGIEQVDNKLLGKLKLKLVEKHLENFELDKALTEVFSFIDHCNEYVQDKKPWETKDPESPRLSGPQKTQQEKKFLEARKVLYELVDSIKVIAILLWPFVPETSEKIAKQFGFKIDYNLIGRPFEGRVKKGEILFRKIE